MSLKKISFSKKAILKFYLTISRRAKK